MGDAMTNAVYAEGYSDGIRKGRDIIVAWLRSCREGRLADQIARETWRDGPVTSEAGKYERIAAEAAPHEVGLLATAELPMLPGFGACPEEGDAPRPETAIPVDELAKLRGVRMSSGDFWCHACLDSGCHACDPPDWPDFEKIALETIEDREGDDMTSGELAHELRLSYESGYEHGKGSRRERDRAERDAPDVESCPYTMGCDSAEGCCADTIRSLRKVANAAWAVAYGPYTEEVEQMAALLEALEACPCAREEDR